MVEDEVNRLREEMRQSKEQEHKARVQAERRLKERKAEFDKLNQEHHELIKVFKQHDGIRAS